jgi:hypothetical protein
MAKKGHTQAKRARELAVKERRDRKRLKKRETASRDAPGEAAARDAAAWAVQSPTAE